jgi:purine-binding chemotaxis protein CheW
MPATNDEERAVSTAVLPTLDRPSRRSEAAESVQLVSFRLAEEEYGVEITKVQEIILPGEITRVPRTPDHVKGLINLRSEVIPVIDLRCRFGLPAQEATDETRIVVVSVRGKTLGIIVDAVSEVLRAPLARVIPPPPAVTASGHEYLAGLVQLDDRLVILLDIDRVLGDEAAAAAL